MFVFAFTQVTTLLADDPTWPGIGRGVLVLGALWWAWAGYAWFTNAVDPDEGPVRAAMFGAMASMFVAALAVPDAFGDHGVLFGVAFLGVTVVHLVLYSTLGRADRALKRAVMRLAPTALAAAAVITAAGFVDGSAREALWVLALGLAYVGGLLSGSSGWQVHPAHFAERHELIVIIALGESLVAIGVGARDTTLDLGVAAAAVLGLALATALWLAYFDFFSIAGRQVLLTRDGPARVAFARDVYTYLHFPLIAGIVLVALALKTTLSNVGDELSTPTAFALCGGVALYYLTFSGIRLRVERRLSRGRFVTALVVLALIPLAVEVPALLALAIVAAVLAALHAYELIWWREQRAEMRALRTSAAAS